MTYSLPATPDRVRMRMRLQPFGLEVLESLVETGDLDPTLVTRLPTYDLASTVIEWRADEGQICATARP